MNRLLLTLGVVVCLAGPARAEGDATPPPSAAEAAPAPGPAPPALVNLNTATEEELIKLPGIGPAKAAAILLQRKKVGSFKRIEDVLRVRGIGRKLLHRLRPLITLAPP